MISLFSVFSAPLWFDKLLLNRRDTEIAEKRKEILGVTLKGLVLILYLQGINKQYCDRIPFCSDLDKLAGLALIVLYREISEKLQLTHH